LLQVQRFFFVILPQRKREKARFQENQRRRCAEAFLFNHGQTEKLEQIQLNKLNKFVE
jgi:hypothetical protein